ncbi:HNH endonuclease signature motif containing protein [Arthrobacter sp. 24S4-2]|uniref:HNH endonuclease signature motif containing protein n=1 Tax=Arthrobacter sp. 24S4-2 TaxID=2575374 RepID=UPI0020C7D316|nr:HNH endonuclease signature motif containing protein [Arthrobacter sp. 24S4-2]
MNVTCNASQRHPAWWPRHPGQQPRQIPTDLSKLEGGFRRRCSRPAEHGDHFHPWSKGGSTSLQNFVAACSRCNRTKGARIPSPGQQERLERRRRTISRAR